MAQNREKEETLELTPCPGTNNQACAASRPDPARVDPVQSNPDEPHGSSFDDLGQPWNRESGQNGDVPGARVEAKRVTVAVNRCWGCGKRVRLLTGFRCRCGELFCAQHRYSDKHDCGFDYKAVGRAAIARENPVVRSAKLLKV